MTLLPKDEQLSTANQPQNLVNVSKTEWESRLSTSRLLALKCKCILGGSGIRSLSG